MVLFVIFISIIFLISLIVFILCLSSFEIEVKKFNFNNNMKDIKLTDYLIFARIKLLKRFTVFKLSINDNRINKMKGSKLISKNILDEILKIQSVKNLKKLDIRINKLNLEVNIDLVDTIFTSVAVAIISTLLSVVLANNNKKECYYKISPIYKNNIQIIIKLNCIINIKMVHIINIVYMLFKDRSVKYDEGTSNRRAYVCSND